MLGFFGRKKPVAVMNGKRFIAAFSARPFKEAKNGGQFPDYTFHEYGNMYWCVRVGDIDVRWGFGNGEVYANGVITLSRMNVSAASFSGKGLPYVKVGEIFYLYEEELKADRVEGFVPYMRKKINGAVAEMAKGKSPEELEVLVGSIGEHPEIREILNEHRLVVRSAHVGGVGAAGSPEKSEQIKFISKEVRNDE